MPDANQILAELRSLIEDDDFMTVDRATALLMRIRDLDEHLSNGGSIPDAWRPADNPGSVKYVAPDGEHIDAGNPLNRRSIIEIHLKELARYLGVDFPGEMSEMHTINDLTGHIMAGFFPEN